MKRKVIIILFYLILIQISFPINVKAQNILAVKFIPEELLKDSPAGIIRHKELWVEWQEDNTLTVKAKFVASILNAGGNDLALFELPYTSDFKNIHITGMVMDMNGKMIKKLKKSEIKDVSNYSSFSTFEDTRSKNVNLKQYKYPYSIVIEYEYASQSTFLIPSFFPYESIDIPVEKAKATYRYDVANPFRFKSIHCHQVKEWQSTPQLKTKEFTFNNLPKIKVPSFLPLDHLNAPLVLAAPSEFTYFGKNGDMSTWESFGKFIYELNDGRDQLIDRTKLDVQSIVKSSSSTLEIIEKCYEYLQSKTRYVSIQYGIGKLQPFTAEEVDRYGYGDCKALTNYMSALLKEAKIDSYYSIIKAGNYREIFKDFPGSQFNHVILAVPIERDTIWLECTSQKLPFGYLGNFTSDRYALLTSKEGGTLVKTPSYGSKNNKLIVNLEAKLDEQGSITGNFFVETHAEINDRLEVFRFVDKKEEDKNKWIQEFSKKRLEDQKWNFFKLNKGPIPQTQMEQSFSMKSFASKAGNRLILSTSFFDWKFSMVSLEENREEPFIISNGYTEFETLILKFPPNFYPEFIPEDWNFESEFGTISISYHTIEEGVKIEKKIKMDDGIFASSKISEFNNFKGNLINLKKNKIILVKET